jgi:ClpP class serine protease
MEIWACEIEHLRSYVDRVFCADRDTVTKAAAAYASRGSSADILSVTGDTATIIINGTLTKQQSVIAWLLGLGGTTYSDILGAVERVSADDSVKRVTLAIDSPGGDISGLDDVWIALRALGEKKELVAENRGLMASAAYWIATAASRITAVSPVALTGSIGVYAVIRGNSDEKLVRIVSKNAPNKNPDPGTEGGRDIYQAQIDAMERVFIKRVAEGRGVSTDKVIKDFGQGAILVAVDPDNTKNSASSVGMIDAVTGNFGTGKTRKLDRNLATDIPNNIDTKPKKVSKENAMDLKELLATDGALKGEVEALERSAYQRGVDEARKRGSQAIAVLASDQYPGALRALAAKVLNGELGPDTLVGAIAGYDAYVEVDKATHSTQESKADGATPAEAPKVTASNGEIHSEDDHKAAVNRLRAAQGLKEIN